MGAPDRHQGPVRADRDLVLAALALHELGRGQGQSHDLRRRRRLPRDATSAQSGTRG